MKSVPGSTGVGKGHLENLLQAMACAPASYMSCIGTPPMRVSPKRPRYAFATPSFALQVSSPTFHSAEQLQIFAGLLRALSSPTFKISKSGDFTTSLANFLHLPGTPDLFHATS